MENPTKSNENYGNIRHKSNDTRVPFEAPQSLVDAFDAAVPDNSNRSEVLRSLMEQYVRGGDRMGERISELEDELGEIEAEKKSLDDKRRELEAELESLKEERERRKSQSEWETRITPVVDALRAGEEPDEIHVHNAKVAGDAPDHVETNEDVIEYARTRVSDDGA